MLLAGARIEACQSRAQIGLFPSFSSLSPHCISPFTWLPLPKYGSPRYHTFFWVQWIWREKSYHLWKKKAYTLTVTPTYLHCGVTRLSLIINWTLIATSNVPIIFVNNCSKGMNKLYHSLLAMDGAPFLTQEK